MTTNHRPTLESKRGKTQGIRDTISHKRSLPLQTEVKYRQDARISKKAGRKAVDELKRELLRSEVEAKSEGAKELAMPRDDEGGEEVEEWDRRNEDEKENDKKEEKGDGDEKENHKEEEKGNEDDHSENSDASDDDPESDSETEQLLAELAKIKAEKLKAAEATPIPPTDSQPPKKTWRKTAFRNLSTDKKSEDFTNDTLKSDFHQSFLSKYIR